MRRVAKTAWDVGASADVGSRYAQVQNELTPDYARQGMRMEDAHAVVERCEALVVCVADGHNSAQIAPGLVLGGREVADAACHALAKNASNLATCASNVFADCQRSARDEVLEKLRQYTDVREQGGAIEWHVGGVWRTLKAGTTLSALSVDAGMNCHLAYVGDSMCAIVTGEGNVVMAGSAHDATNTEEARRLQAMGVKRSRGGKGRRFVMKIGPRREAYELAVSRAIGHFSNAAVLQEPTQIEWGPEWRAIVVATDGVWDAVPASECATLVQSALSAQEVAESIISTVKARACKTPKDNATVVVVKKIQEEVQNSAKHRCTCAVM